MNHELALKLKEAGFPQVQPHSSENDYTDCTKPTLSELIEACGNSFGQFVKCSDGWVAENNWRGSNKTVTIRQIAGLNPEEAVANLWLELNKK